MSGGSVKILYESLERLAQLVFGRHYLFFWCRHQGDFYLLNS